MSNKIGDVIIIDGIQEMIVAVSEDGTSIYAALSGWIHEDDAQEVKND